jgi:propionyl-CoA carboxylase alpha chain
MQEQAIQLALAVDYKSAGTVEMLCDENLNFYFLEMNTRLQVEHPITECVTNEDLVYHMIQTARGVSLKDHFLQKVQDHGSLHTHEEKEGGKENHFYLSPTGHAIESRVYSEDPYKQFLPSTGTLVGYKEPSSNKPFQIPAVDASSSSSSSQLTRVDSGVQEGSEISIYYDPMISKLVTFTHDQKKQHMEDRADCIALMEEALNNYYIQGVDHNIPFLQSIMRNGEFREGIYSTHFIPKHYKDNTLENEALTFEEERTVALLSAIHFYTSQQRTFAASTTTNNAYYQKVVCMLGKEYQDGALSFQVQQIDHADNSSFLVTALSKDGSTEEQYEVSNFNYDGYFLQGTLNNTESMVIQPSTNVRGHALINGKYQFVNAVYEDEYDSYKHMILPPEKDLSNFVVCPMPGTVLQLPLLAKLEEDGFVEVEAGETVAIIEAMKMQNLIKAPKKGVIKNIFVKEGERCAVDALLMGFETDEAKA